MFDAYKIGISVALTGNVSTALGLWKKQFQEAGVMTSALQKRLDDLRNTGKKAALELGAAFALSKPFASMITDAAKLQKEMIGIGLGARGTAQDLDKLRGVIEDVAGKTMFSNIDVAKMAKQLATGTGWNRQQIASDLPVFAKFADAQQIMKGTSYSESIKTGITLSHLAGYNKPDDISRYLDTLTKASMIVPGGLGEVGHALKYSQAILKNNLGVSDEDSIMLVTALNRMGFAGSRGGTGLSAAMTRTIPGIFGSGLLKGKSAYALHNMGFSDDKGRSTVFTNGKFDPMKWLNQMSTYEGQEYATHPEAIARQNIMKNMQWAFGVNGSRPAALLSSPAARTALAAVQESFKNGAGTAAIQETFADQSVLQQYNNAKTNMTTFMSELGYKLLPAASEALKAFNGEIAKLTDWVRNPKNDTAVKTGLYTGIGATGLLATGGILNLVKFGLKGLGLMGAANGAAAAGTVAKAGVGGLLGGFALGGGVVAGSASGVFDEHFGVGQRWAQQRPEQFLKFEKFMDAVTFGLMKSKDDQPIQVNLNVDGKTLASVVTDRMTQQMNGPSTGNAGFDPRRGYTPTDLLDYH